MIGQSAQQISSSYQALPPALQCGDHLIPQVIASHQSSYHSSANGQIAGLAAQQAMQSGELAAVLKNLKTQNKTFDEDTAHYALCEKVIRTVGPAEVQKLIDKANAELQAIIENEKSRTEMLEQVLTELTLENADLEEKILQLTARTRGLMSQAPSHASFFAASEKGDE